MKYLILMMCIVFSGCTVTKKAIDNCEKQCSTNGGLKYMEPNTACYCNNGVSTLYIPKEQY